MIFCLDTDTLVQAFARHHPFNPILEAWVSGRMTWAVSTPILLEYEEVLTRISGPVRWRKLALLMDLAADLDDNIFSDCAITADADFLITEDKHFAPLADAGYKPRPLSPQEFITRFLAAGGAKLVLHLPL